MKKILIFILLISGFTSNAQYEANYDESKISEYTLPSILSTQDGSTVKNAQEWWQIRRPEILELFSSQVYGKIPEADVKVSFEISEEKSPALEGKAIRKQINIVFKSGNKEHNALLLIYLPVNSDTPVPLFLGYNFYGNHTIIADPAILISNKWTRNNPNFLIFNNSLDKKSRGCRAGRWPVLNILERGYGLAVMFYGDLDPDFDDGFKNGVQPLFYKKDQTKPASDEWGSIGAWAYGLSCALDYMETDDDINHNKVAVIGHSRLGKTSLWAGAMDDRFALVISNESGCGGAALSRRRIGETVEIINTAFPHWFCDNFNIYNNNEDALPVDQHQLIALIAPRPVYIASAAGDQWADPKGEYLAGYHAGTVYELFGKKGLESRKMPDENKPITSGYVGYHIRSGNHDLTYFDWEQFLDFTDNHLK